MTKNVEGAFMQIDLGITTDVYAIAVCNRLDSVAVLARTEGLQGYVGNTKLIGKYKIKLNSSEMLQGYSKKYSEHTCYMASLSFDCKIYT